MEPASFWMIMIVWGIVGFALGATTPDRVFYEAALRGYEGVLLFMLGPMVWIAVAVLWLMDQ